MARDQPLDRATLIHEAGHAVGRYLTADAFGIERGHSISHIDIYPDSAGPIGHSQDGKMVLVSQATTFGTIGDEGTSRTCNCM